MAQNSDLHINNLQRFGDIQRTYLWQVQINGLSGAEEDMKFLVREATWAGRTNTQIESYFLGMKQFFPGKEEFSGDLTLQFEEHESLFVSKTLYKWKQQIFDVTRGASNAVNTGEEKAELAKDITLTLLAYNNEPLPCRMRFKNAWLKNVDDVSLSMSGGEAMMVGATFQYDYWVLVDEQGNEIAYESL